MRRFYISSMFMFGVVVFLFLSPKPSFAATCDGRANMAAVGRICVDQYEASVWSRAPTDSGATTRGTQFGVGSDDYPCSDNGNDCHKSSPGKIFAASVPGVTPSGSTTWFQAQQACANVGKRLLTNGEWQMAAAGTPDGSADCNITIDIGSEPELTGSNPNCVSNWIVFDMAGNLSEWVEDWIQDNDDVDGGSISSALYGNDAIIGVDEAFPTTDRFPAALVRGGNYTQDTRAGVFALAADLAPSDSVNLTGFRCAR